MKHMKFVMAILAIGFVIVGSSFTKSNSAEDYGLVSKTQIGTSNIYTYEIIVLEEVSDYGCAEDGETCLVNLDLEDEQAPHQKSGALITVDMALADVINQSSEEHFVFVP